MHHIRSTQHKNSYYGIPQWGAFFIEKERYSYGITAEHHIHTQVLDPPAASGTDGGRYRHRVDPGDDQRHMG